MYALKQIARIIGETIQETEYLLNYLHITAHKTQFTLEHLNKLRLIQRMHKMGFKEEDITLVLKERISIDDVLKLRICEIENNIEREKQVINNIKAVRKGLVNDGHFVPELTYGKPYIVDTPEKWVCSIRQRVHTHAINYLLKRLQDKMSAYNLQPSGNLIRVFHEDVPSMNDADMELMYPVTLVQKNQQANLKLLPPVKSLCLDVRGEYDILSTGYAILLKWIEDEGYEVCGQMYDVFNCGVLTSKGRIPHLQLDSSKNPMIFKVRLCIPIERRKDSKE